jgi:hypothetical protein
VTDLARAIRLTEVLNQLGISEEQIEDLIEQLSAHCFKQGMSVEDFAQEVTQSKILCGKLEIPVENLSSYVEEKRAGLHFLKKLKVIKGKIHQSADKYQITLNDLQDYRTERPLDKKTIKFLQKELEKKNKIIDWLIKMQREEFLKRMRMEQWLSIFGDDELEKANRELDSRGKQELQPYELTRLVSPLMHFPSKRVDIIVEIRNKSIYSTAVTTNTAGTASANSTSGALSVGK